MNEIAILTVSVAALSSAAIAISSMAALIQTKEENRVLKQRLKNMNVKIRADVLSQMTYSKRLWFIQEFGKKDRTAWEKAKNSLK